MFALLNVKWGEPTFGTPSGTVTWSSDLAGDLVLAPGVTDADIEASLQAAFDRWEGVAAIDFEQVGSGGDILVDGSALNPMREPGDPFVAGQATWDPNFGGLNSLDAGLIEFATELLWSPDGVGATNFFAVALHEIGHIMGLQHPGDASQVMNATIFVDDLATGDIQGAQFLYGTDDDDVELEAGFPNNAAEIGLSSGDPGPGGGGGGGGGAGILALLLGILALFGGLLTGGAGAAVAMAAGRMDEDDVEPANQDQPNTYWHGDHQHFIGEDGLVSHPVYIADAVVADLPTIDFTQQPNPCGCVGMCPHIMNNGDPDEDDLWIV